MLISLLGFVLLLSPQAEAFDGGIFKLPELVVFTNNTYLLRKEETQLDCQLHSDVSWPGTFLDDVQWLKDGVPIAELVSKNGGNDVVEDGTTLRVVQATHHTEGDYQCSALVRNVILSNNQSVDSRLVSAPVKLRRARITKFERYASEIIRVRQGQVARLPCFGLPDVIPGPPEIWFEKQGHEGLPLGRTGNERFIATPSGLQIALTQPTDAGKYFCVVRNWYTNQTRKAPRPITLLVEVVVHPLPRTRSQTPPPPKIVYPESLNYSEPVPYHVVAGQTAILECVISDAKVVWNKPDFSMPPISLTDDRARIRQIWGNLRIKQVTVDDSGEYVCHGVSAIGPNDLARNDHPKVTYRLVVHAPTNVRLVLAQQVHDKSWQLSCYAHNLRYEIPMVYVNGLALIDAMEQMGVPPQTNFYTNPINVTLRANNPLAGSIQCISRPAMEEAEVYGTGLERGRAMNLYVDEQLNQRKNLIAVGPSNTTQAKGMSAQMACVPNSSNTSVKWFKGEHPLEVQRNQRFVIVGTATLEILDLRLEDEGWYTCEISDSNGLQQSRATAYLNVERPTSELSSFQELADEGDVASKFSIPKPLAFVTGGNNIRVQWGISTSHPLLNRLVNFIVEIRRKNGSEASSEWIVADQVQPHVRATTIRRLIPRMQYQFRISAAFNDRTTSTSETTDWVNVEPSPNTILIPVEPQITRLQTVSHDSMLVAWDHTAPTPNMEADKLIVSYVATEIDDDEVKMIEVSSASREMLLTGLESDTEYKVTVIAENAAGRSPPSRPRIARTYVYLDDYDGTFWGRLKGSFWPSNGMHFAIIIAALIIALILLVLLGCLTWCQLKECNERQAKGYKDGSAQRNGTDGHRKSQMYQEPLLFNNDPISELSPLTYNDIERNLPEGIDPEERRFHHFEARPIPNLYGNDDHADSLRGSRLSMEYATGVPGYVNLRRPDTSVYGTSLGNGLATIRGRRSVLSSHERLPPPPQCMTMNSAFSPFKSPGHESTSVYESQMPPAFPSTHIGYGRIPGEPARILSYSPDCCTVTTNASSAHGSSNSPPMPAEHTHARNGSCSSGMPGMLINGGGPTRSLCHSPSSSGCTGEMDHISKASENGHQMSTFKSNSPIPPPASVLYGTGTLDRRRMNGGGGPLSSRGGSISDMMRSLTQLND